jgi:hypothetical protein
MFHVYVVSYVSLGRSPYRRALECHYARLWYLAVSTGTVCPVMKGKVTNRNILPDSRSTPLKTHRSRVTHNL